jgi:hypothetical protein
MFACVSSERVSTELDGEQLRTADREELKTSELLGGDGDARAHVAVDGAPPMMSSSSNIHFANCTAYLSLLAAISDRWMDTCVCLV